jgi:hypothetical protein
LGDGVLDQLFKRMLIFRAIAVNSDFKIKKAGEQCREECGPVGIPGNSLRNLPMKILSMESEFSCGRDAFMMNFRNASAKFGRIRKVVADIYW